MGCPTCTSLHGPQRQIQGKNKLLAPAKQQARATLPNPSQCLKDTTQHSRQQYKNPISNAGQSSHHIIRHYVQPYHTHQQVSVISSQFICGGSRPSKEARRWEETSGGNTILNVGDGVKVFQLDENIAKPNNAVNDISSKNGLMMVA
jgi:hypothetical protein